MLIYVSLRTSIKREIFIKKVLCKFLLRVECRTEKEEKAMSKKKPEKKKKEEKEEKEW